MIAALLLAAGSARRFGAPKLLQDLDGKPIVRWSAEALAGAPIDEVLVVVPPEHREVQRALAGLRVRYVVNHGADAGIGTSIAAGVAAFGADTEAVLVALADEPGVPREALRRVYERYREGGASIVVPLYDGVRGHPVLFDRSVFGEVGMLGGDAGARALTERDPGRAAFVELGVAKPTDVDTPADLERLRAAMSTSLLDQLMPAYDMKASYGIDVPAPPDAVYRALREADLSKALITRALMAIRMLGRRRGGESFVRFGLLPERGTFFRLGERAPREMVAGILGRFWSLTGNVCEGDRAAFLEALSPGTAKAAWNFRVDPTPRGARLTTETRVLCADDDSRRRFRRYWAVVGPFSGLIRREMLRLIRRQAQFIPSPSPDQ